MATLKIGSLAEQTNEPPTIATTNRLGWPALSASQLDSDGEHDVKRLTTEIFSRRSSSIARHAR
jgi:hypothetical protein